MIDVEGLPAWAGLPPAPLSAARVAVAGIPYDGSATYRRGARHAPAHMRRLGAVMPPIDECGRCFGDLTVGDLGDLALGDSVATGWQAAAQLLAEVPPGAFLTVFGGDHCSAIPVLAAQARRHPDLAVLWVDAHPDLCDSSRGGRWTCGCALRRALECAGLPPSAAVLAACRDFDPEELAFIREHNVLMVTTAALTSEPATAADRIAAAVAGRPLHISFDIDALDPAFAPGTEIPCAAGLSTRQALDLVAAVVPACRLVGLDVCEVAPVGADEITVLAALKIVFETWAKL
ncbi:MAG TPA: arginase family protein [Candidatus Dormibacteraeota bacterium]|nr:arginase family protein [Candidatus Dormibacteraeota bacterium]